MWTKTVHGYKLVDGKNIPLYQYQHENNRVRILEGAYNKWQVQVTSNQNIAYQGYKAKQEFASLNEAFKDAEKWNTQMDKVIREAFERYKATGIVKPILHEGGNAFSDVGTIHISEIEPTLHWMEKEFSMSNLSDRVLGSVGKSEYSGDIDVAVDPSKTDMKELAVMLRTKLGDQSVTGVAGNVSVRVPIAHYDKTKDGRQPRTGFVQVDFLPGEPGWMKTFYHSPGDQSKYKGVHRNLALAGLASLLGAKSTKELDDFDRPISTVRWSWGVKNALVKVKKTSRKNKQTGKYVRAQDTEILGEPVRDPKKVAHILFKGKAGPEALGSLETIIDAVKKTYSKQEQDSAYKQIAQSFANANGNLIDGFEFPKEIEQYVSRA